jgi:CubicO group peptidase (beta-lactamase class C family)
MSFYNLKICVKVSLVVLSLLFLQPTTAQYNFQELDASIDASKKVFGGNLSVLVYRDGKIIYSKSIGEFTPKSQEPIASSSKWLTAALVMVMAEEGKIGLDDKVSKYLPIFGKYSKGYITIRHCLGHLTGIESEPIKLINLLKRNKFSSLEEEVDDFASKKDIIANPGIEFRYSNVGLNIAARVLEVATRKGFEQLMQEKILRPLQMRNTSFAGLNAVNPSGGAVSTANDYMNFLSMMLNKGMYNGKKILSEQSVALMQTAQTTLPMIKYAPKVAEGYNYGMGEWILASDEDGNSTVVASPGLFGTWPMIDKCRGYACIFFTKGLLGEDKKDTYLLFKKLIDQQIVANCK